MKKSKYLVLNSFYFDFNDDLTEITNVKELFKKQNILDLFRFDKIKSITEYKFNGYNINFVYLPKNIEKIEYCAFYENQIQILDLSNCINLKNIGEFAFAENQIKHLKLPDNIEEIYNYAFSKNQIEILDLSNCIKLQTIELSFDNNLIKTLSLPKNIEIIQNFAFRTNQIEILDLSNYIKLKNIKEYAFSDNPLNEIKILDNINIEYYKYLKNDLWTKFVIYYNDTNKKSGDYKLENNEWKWYPL